MVANTFTHPVSSQSIATARIDWNESTESILTSFYSPAAPVTTSFSIDGQIPATVPDGTIFRSSSTGALYVKDAARSLSNPIYGGDFTRNGIALVVETDIVHAVANLGNYEQGELFAVPVSNSRLYMKTSSVAATFVDIGIPPTDSITSAMIKTDAITAIKIAADAVTETKIADDAVTGLKIPTSANVARLNVAQEYSRAQNFDASVLTDGTNISWDLALNQVSEVILAGNRTLDNPTNMQNGATYVLTVRQDATGTRTLAYGTVYLFPGGTTPVLTTTVNASDVITFLSNGTNMFGVVQSDFK